jgi:hypothetical protein
MSGGFLERKRVAAMQAALVSHEVAGYNGLLSVRGSTFKCRNGKESVQPDRKLTVKFIPERLRVPNPREERNSDSVDPARVLLILLRLGERYYDVPPASDRIASCVWAELTDSEEHPSVLS